MCLDNVGERLVATEDIKCYKLLNCIKVPTEFALTCHGKKAKAIVHDMEFDVIISICNGNMYLCSDNRSLDGRECPEKFGKTYSWIVDPSTTSVICKRKELICDGYKTPYQNAIVRIGETYISELRCEYLEAACYIVREGLHSYANRSSYIHHRDVEVECIIPKGASYYVGTFRSDVSYASDKLVYSSVIL